jgi:integrase
MSRRKGTDGQAEFLTVEGMAEVNFELLRGTHGLRDSTIWLLGCTTGCRVGEILELRVREVWVSGGSAATHHKPLPQVFLSSSRTKTRTSRIVYLSSLAQQTILIWMQARGVDAPPDAWLFPGQKAGDHLSYRRYEEILRGVADRLGIPLLRSHSMRRSSALLGKELSGDLLLVKEHLGHEDLGTTQVYTRNSRPAMVSYMNGIGSALESALLKIGQ